MSTPGIKVKEEGTPLESREATMYRAHVARANYLSQDRSDIQFAVKELCRKMSAPMESDWLKLKRLAPYLKDKTRSKTLFQYQGPPAGLEVYTDTDYAGCERTRRSKSGGVILFGTHLLNLGVQH